MDIIEYTKPVNVLGQNYAKLTRYSRQHAANFIFAPLQLRTFIIRDSCHKHLFPLNAKLPQKNHTDPQHSVLNCHTTRANWHSYFVSFPALSAATYPNRTLPSTSKRQTRSRFVKLSPRVETVESGVNARNLSSKALPVFGRLSTSPSWHGRRRHWRFVKLRSCFPQNEVPITRR